MNKQRKTSHILNVFQYDDDGHVVLPASLTLSIAPGSEDNNSKVPTTAWTRSYIASLGYVTGNQSVTISGDATGSGTTSIELTLANTAVTPGTYGSSTLVPVVTVDSKGRITSVSTASISGALTFTGDVTGTGTTGTSTQLTLANSGVTAGTYTKVTVDSKGRVTVGASATTSDISEGTNLYYTDARVLTYLGANNYATQSYVGTQIANLIDSAPGTLDTLNELAAALGDDPNFATTVATSIGTKQNQLNGTGFVKVSGTTVSYDNSTYLTSFTETDPIYVASSWYGTTNNSSNWNTAFGWGNHASAGYLTTSSAASTYASLTGSYANPSWITSLAYSKITGVPAFLTSYTETDPFRVTSVAVSGTSTKTITLTRADSSTVTTTWTDIDTDTNTFASSLGFSGGTLTLTNNNASTVAVSLDGRYLQSYSETDTLASVTARGASTTGGINVNGDLGVGNGTTSISQAIRLGGDNAAGGRLYFQYAGDSSYIDSYGGHGGGQRYRDLQIVARNLNLTSSGGTVNANGSQVVTNNSGTWSINVTGNSATTSQRSFSGDISTDGMGRFTGWYTGTAATGLAAEIGVSSGQAYIIAYNRQTSTYGTLNLESASTTLRLSGSTVNVVTGALQQGGNQVLHAGNYNSYSPTLTGGSASGTWGISISGNAATATSAGSATTATTTTGNAGSVTYLMNRTDSAAYPVLWGANYTNGIGTIAYSCAAVTIQSSTGTLTATTFSGALNGNATTASSAINLSGLGVIQSTSTGTSYTANYQIRENSGGSGNTNEIYAPQLGFHWGGVVASSIMMESSGRIAIRNNPGGSYENFIASIIYSTDSVRAPIFYDSNDTSYYLDPNGNSVLTTATFNVNGSSTIAVTSAGTNASMIRAGSGDELYLGGNGTWQMRFSGANVLMDNGGYLQNNESIRAPIFYDSNDTAYYLNPAGGSRLRNLYVGDSGDDWSDPGGWGTQVRFSNAPHVKFVLHARTPGIEAGMYVHTPGSVFIGSYTGHDVSMMWGGNRKMQITNSYVYTDVYLEAAGSLRAPIFYDSNDTGYYLDPNDTSNLSRLIVNNAVSGAALLLGSNNTSRIINDNARKALVINASLYPALHLNAYDGGNPTHGAYIVMSGNLTSGGYRIWTMGIANSNPGTFSIGYSDLQDGNGHYGVGDNWSGNDAHHGRLIVDTSGNTKIRGMLYVNGTSGGITSGNAVIHAGNIGSQSVASAGNANTVGGIGAGVFFRDLGFEGGGSNADSIAVSRSAFTYAAAAPHSGPLTHFGAGGYGLQINATYHGGDQNISYRVRNGDAGAWKSWFSFVTSANIGSQSVNHASRATRSNGQFYIDDDHGCSVIGVYSSYRFQGVYSMGSAYVLPTNGTTPGNLYGMAWSHPNAGGQATRLNDHGLLVMINGVTQSAFSSNIWAAGDVTAFSDARVKTNIKIISNAIEKIQSIRGVTFTRTDMTDTTTRHAGVIAQEILEVLPEVVTEDGNGMYSVAYGNLTSLLIEAVKEQQLQIEDLKNKLDLLTQNK